MLLISSIYISNIYTPSRRKIAINMLYCIYRHLPVTTGRGFEGCDRC